MFTAAIAVDLLAIAIAVVGFAALFALLEGLDRV